MPVTLMAIYRRPEGGDEALETLRRRYTREHLPLIRKVPGLRSIHVQRVVHAFGETDLVMIAEMVFDDRAALDAGMASDEMRAAGRNLRDIAPGLATVVVLGDEPGSDEPRSDEPGSGEPGSDEPRSEAVDGEPAP